MRMPFVSATDSRTSVSILSLSAIASDHESLERIVMRRECTDHTGVRWIVSRADALIGAFAALQDGAIPLVIAEREVPPGTWKDVLEHMVKLRHAPLLIVTSRLADECLWGEVLNLGAYDLLAKPFDDNEVIRVIGAAWRSWQNQRQHAVRRQKVRTA